MKLSIWLSIFFFSIQICVSQKDASLSIKTDQNSLKFINSIYFIKNSTSLHTWLFDIKNISINDLDLGHYRIEFITCFLDTIVKDIHINKNQKFRINYPDRSFYQAAENPDAIIEDFLIDDEAILKVYIKSNIYDHTFYHQVLRITKSQDHYSGYYSCHNYGPDTSEGLRDTIANFDIAGNDMKGIIEFLYHNQVSTNPNAYIHCNHFSEIYVMNNKQYFYLNICETDLEKTINLMMPGITGDTF